MYNPDSFANFFLVIESACIEPEKPIGDFHSSSIKEQRPFIIVLERSPTVEVQPLRGIQTQGILFLKSMSERGGSDIISTPVSGVISVTGLCNHEIE